MLEIRKIISLYDSLDHNNEKVALASVVNVEASSYRRIGARMLIRSNGLWVGGISGGCLEGDALRQAQHTIFTNTPSLVVYDTREDDSNQIGVGLGCNGKIEVLLIPIDPSDPDNEIELLRSLLRAEQPNILAKVISTDGKIAPQNILIKKDQPTPPLLNISTAELEESIQLVKQKKSHRVFELKSDNKSHRVLLEFIRPETRLIIIGDNYDVNAMAQVGQTLGWEIWIIGRLSRLGKDLVNKVQRVISFEKHSNVQTHDYTAVVLMSHDYKWDQIILQHFIKESPPYLGLLGPRKRFHKMNADLVNVDLTTIEFIHSPTGLDLGAESPEEIAHSIASEILSVFRQKNGQPLKYKEGPIHSRTYE